MVCLSDAVCYVRDASEAEVLYAALLPVCGQVDVFGAREATRIPLAYGVFCTAFDWAVAVYFVYRRGQWVAAWKSRA